MSLNVKRDLVKTLDVGKVYQFNPCREYSSLYLSKRKPENITLDSIYALKSVKMTGGYVIIRKKTIFIILKSDLNWKYLKSYGLSGWININSDMINKSFVEIRSVKRYDDWQGNNFIFCNGKFIFGSDFKLFLLTNSLILLLSALFYYVFVCKENSILLQDNLQVVMKVNIIDIINYNY